MLREARRGVRFGLLLGFWFASSSSAADWSVTAGIGAARSFSTPLSIDQDGFPELRLSARYDNRPFETPPHWFVRIGRGSGAAAWEFQYLHHKLYLRNRPPEVARFDITHGYNIYTLGPAWRRGGSWLRAGAGVVVAHPESTVRGRRFEPKQGILGLDQYLAGPALVLGASREWRLGGRVFLSPELQLSAGHARVPIRYGRASAPNIAAHFLISFGWRS